MRDRWPDFTALHVFGYVNSRQDKITAWRVAEPKGPTLLTAYPVTMLDGDPVLSSHVVILETPFLKVHVDLSCPLLSISIEQSPWEVTVLFLL